MDFARILLVDADPAVHESLVSVFRSREWEVISAYRTTEAWARVQSTSFDVVLTSLSMSDMGGLDLLHRIHALRPETKVLLMGAESSSEDIIQALREQAFGWCSKPLAPRALAESVGQALRVSSWRGDIEVISAHPQWIDLRVRCKLEAADRLLQFLREMKHDLTLRQRDDIMTALRELLANAIEHGANSDPGKRFLLSYVRTARAVIYRVQDPGEGFSLESLCHAAISNPPDQPIRHSAIRAEQGFRPGGFGILMARHLVDELLYNEKGNEVVLIKYI
jgi:DNA-binding NarL/FixJ family response regulator